MLKVKGHDYVCVSRTKLKEYAEIKSSEESITVYDKNDSPVKLKLVEKLGCKDTCLYVRS